MLDNQKKLQSLIDAMRTNVIGAQSSVNSLKHDPNQGAALLEIIGSAESVIKAAGKVITEAQAMRAEKQQ